MLFVSYAQPLSLAAHTAGAALIEDFNGKEGTLKAEHTKEKIITLIPSKPSSFIFT